MNESRNQSKKESAPCVKQQLADSEEAVQILAKGGAEYRQQLDESRQLNSELLAALKLVLEVRDCDYSGAVGEEEADDAARAAIDREEGRAQP